MNTTEFEPGPYIVISDDNANIRREPRIIDNPSNVVGQHTPGTRVEVYEIFVDKAMMVWGRISAVHPGTGKANWMCIYTGNRANLRAAVPHSDGQVLKVMINDKVIFETTLN